MLDARRLPVAVGTYFHHLPCVNFVDVLAAADGADHDAAAAADAALLEVEAAAARGGTVRRVVGRERNGAAHAGAWREREGGEKTSWRERERERENQGEREDKRRKGTKSRRKHEKERGNSQKDQATINATALTVRIRLNDPRRQQSDLLRSVQQLRDRHSRRHSDERYVPLGVVSAGKDRGGDGGGRGGRGKRRFGGGDELADYDGGLEGEAGGAVPGAAGGEIEEGGGEGGGRTGNVADGLCRVERA